MQKFAQAEFNRLPIGKQIQQWWSSRYAFAWRFTSLFCGTVACSAWLLPDLSRTLNLPSFHPHLRLALFRDFTRAAVTHTHSHKPARKKQTPHAFSRVRPIRKHGSVRMKASGPFVVSYWPACALLKHAVSETLDEVQRLAGVEKLHSFRLVSPCWWCVPSLYGLPAGGLLSSHIHVPPAHIGALHLLAHHQSDPQGLLSSARSGPFTQTDCNFINFSCL